MHRRAKQHFFLSPLVLLAVVLLVLQDALVVYKFENLFLPCNSYFNTQKRAFFEVFKNLQKLYRWSYFSKCNLGVPGADQWGTPGLHPMCRRGQQGGRATLWWGPHLALHLLLHLPLHSLSRENTPPLFKPEFLAVLARDFRSPCSAHLCCWDLGYLFSVIQIEFCLVEYILSILLL